MVFCDIFYALCDAFTLTELEKNEASRKIQNTPLCSSDELFTCFYEDNETCKSKIKSNEKRD